MSTPPWLKAVLASAPDCSWSSISSGIRGNLGRATREFVLPIVTEHTRNSRQSRVHGVPQGASRQDPQHRPAGGVNGEIKRRTDVVGIYPNEGTVTRLFGAIRLEQMDEWAVQRRDMSLETLAPISDASNLSLLAVE
jgi:hypothetical protein